jgi:hypothetical protein
MTSHSSSATGPAALRASIRDVESSIRRHRSNIGIALGSVAHNVGERMISPGAILAAGLFGAAIQRDHRLRGMRMLAILQTANAGIRLLLTSTSRTSAASHPTGKV